MVKLPVPKMQGGWTVRSHAQVEKWVVTNLEVIWNLLLALAMTDAALIVIVAILVLFFL